MIEIKIVKFYAEDLKRMIDNNFIEWLFLINAKIY